MIHTDPRHRYTLGHALANNCYLFQDEQRSRGEGGVQFISQVTTFELMVRYKTTVLGIVGRSSKNLPYSVPPPPPSSSRLVSVGNGKKSDVFVVLRFGNFGKILLLRHRGFLCLKEFIANNKEKYCN